MSRCREGGDHRHAWPKAVESGLIGRKDDLHLKALGDLREIAGSVVGGKQRLQSPGHWPETVHGTAEGLAGYAIDGNACRLARPHGGDLYLAEIRDDPDFGQRHDKADLRAGGHVFARKSDTCGELPAYGADDAPVPELAAREIARALFRRY